MKPLAYAGMLAAAVGLFFLINAWGTKLVVVGVAQAKVGGALVVLSATLAYVGFMLLVVRPLAARFVARIDGTGLTPGVVVVVLAALFCSALTTELIGIHAVFGAFLLGVVIPHDSALALSFTRRLVDLVTVLLLPAFFALTGMRTQIPPAQPAPAAI
jgi:Kef-type K+ transport system membrane component KefB